MEMGYSDYIAADIRNQIAQEQQEFNLVAILKPTVQKDGNQWCVLYGEDLQTGIAGFGDSPQKAILDFNRQWYKNLKGDM